MNGLVIDAVEFQGQAENVSEGRYPNGGPLRLSMPAPSPRAPNVLPPSYEPPSVSSFEILPGSQCALTFVTSPGHTYRVEFKNDLNAGGWTPLGGDIFAVGNQYTITDPISGIGQRYYRILQVE